MRIYRNGTCEEFAVQKIARVGFSGAPNLYEFRQPFCSLGVIENLSAEKCSRHPWP